MSSVSGKRQRASIDAMIDSLYIIYLSFPSTFGFAFTPTFGLDAGNGPPLYGYNCLDKCGRAANDVSSTNTTCSDNGIDNKIGGALRAVKTGKGVLSSRAKDSKKNQKGPESRRNVDKSGAFASFNWWDALVQEKLHVDRRSTH